MSSSAPPIRRERRQGSGWFGGGAGTLTVAVLAVGALVGASCAGATAEGLRERPAFSAERAWFWLNFQCELGPRTPGGPGHARLREAFAAHAESLGLRCAEDPFDATDPLSGEIRRYTNVVISAGPAGGERLWFGAHWDTRPVCDRDPVPERRGEPLPGANDGASGVAVLLHLAELLAVAPPPLGVDLIFFDGEDSGRASEPATFCLGSQRLAARWRDFGSPLADGTPRGFVLLDMVGERDLAVPMEGYSLGLAAAWTRAVFDRAAELGLTAFQAVPGRAVFDDHAPFLRIGVPAVDLIDFDFPQWHTTADTPAVCSAASLEQVGRLVTDLCYRPPEP